MQNCIVATNSCSGAYDENSAAGIYVLSGTADIINCTIVANNTQGMNSAGTVNLINTIVYFNNGNAEQIAGTFTVTYSDIQGGYVGQGNISVSPNLRPGTLELLSASPLIDMGSPDPRYNDSCFPPSRGTARNDMGAYGGPSACCWASPCGLPVITSNPQSFTACINTSALLCIAAIGDEPLRYQWFYYGTNATNVGVAMAGATNACLTLSNVQSNQAGYYSVTVANAYGTADSTKALLTVTPVCVDLNLHAGLKLTGGNIGQVYQVQYLTNINSTTWLPLTTITQQVSGVFVFDPEPATLPRRFYRVIP